MKILNLDKRTYLVKFLWKATDSKFLFQNGIELKYLIETYGSKGIEYIKVLDETNKFKRISKADLLQFFSWETEAHIYLSNHNFFKK